MKPVIIIPAFSRSHSLERLLNSVENSVYPHKNVALIISIDGGADKEVVKVAKSFSFSSGYVEVIEREVNMGLRKHILWCGDQTEKYGSVIILEDDLIVDPFFYKYAKQALSFYKDEGRIAGIALYSPRYNEHAKLPFEPAQNGTSGYFMKVACSWGQAWSASQWKQFKEWYNQIDEDHIMKNDQLPVDVKEWPSSSWKKFFSSYLTQHDSYIFYPYHSYSTNCAEPGGKHIKGASNNFQVPLGLQDRKRNLPFSFPLFQNNSVKYDAFMEPCGNWIGDMVDVSQGELEADFYGIKPLSFLQKKKYCITSRKSSKPIHFYPLKYRPIEYNLQYPEETGESSELLLSEAKYLLNTDPDEIRIKLSEFFSYFELGTKEFVRAYKKYVLLKKKKKKIYYWIYRKIRFPFKNLFKNIQSQTEKE